MRFTPTRLADVILVEHDVHGDARGYFLETWRADAFERAGIDAHFCQDNYTRSNAGVLRGLHYQVSQPQGKLVRVSRGAAFDVAVDLRRSSPGFGQWVGVELSEDNKRSLWIPPGFAHGFFVTGDCAEFIYRCTAYYSPADERTILWNDPQLGIEWPLGGAHPVVSEKDAAGAPLGEAEVYA